MRTRTETTHYNTQNNEFRKFIFAYIPFYIRRISERCYLLLRVCVVVVVGVGGDCMRPGRVRYSFSNLGYSGKTGLRVNDLTR